MSRSPRAWLEDSADRCAGVGERAGLEHRVGPRAGSLTSCLSAVRSAVARDRLVGGVRE